MAKSEEQKAQKAAPAPEQEGVTEQTTVMAPLSDEAVKAAAEAEKAKDEKGFARVAKYLREGPCPDCGGTRLSARARAPGMVSSSHFSLVPEK